MNRAPTSEKQQVRMAGSAIRTPLWILIPLAGAVLLLLTFAPGASAFKVLSEAGEGAGKTNHPEGLAVNYETGRLYVADHENNRIDVFDSAGNFEKAFGWGVKNGAGEFQTCTTSCRKGLSGAGNGQFNRPTGIAVDNSCFLHDPPLTELTTPTCEEFDSSAGDVYVTDAGNRVQKLDPDGNFILSIGGGVDQTAPGDVCTAESGHTCGAGSAGFEEGEFLVSLGGLNVGVGPGGVVLVVDNLKKEGSSSESKSRLQRFQPSGAEISPQHILSEGGDAFSALAFGLAVESTGDFYVAIGGVTIRKYEPNGTPIAEIPDPFEEGIATVGVLALATDAADNLFAASTAAGVSARVSIIEFDPAGNRLRRFGYGKFSQFSKGLAPYHSANGDIYASEPFFDGLSGYRVLHLDFPLPGPLVFPTIPQGPGVTERPACYVEALGNHKATLNAEINPEGKVTTYHFEYVTQTHFEDEGFENPTETAESASIGANFTLHKAEAQVSPLVPETEYRCRAVATNADGIDEGEEGAFTTLPPLEIVDTSVSEAGSEAATLNAKVNPLGIPATGYFEYVEEATYLKDIAELGPGHGFDHARKAPDVDGGEEEIAFGAGEAPVARAATASGLSPATAYRYRVVATDSLIAPDPPPNEVFGPTRSFRTYVSGEGALPDDRAYELVSPAQKNSAEVAVPGLAGGLFFQENSVRIQAAATSGESVTYTSWTSFAQAEGAQAASQYLSKRTPSGWTTENISPFGFLKNPVFPPYRGFTPDLGFGALVTSEPPLTPEAQEGAGIENLYLRDNQTGALQALTIEAPQTTGEGFCAGYAGASVDGSRAFFAGKGAMAGAPVGKGFSLYEWSAAEGLKLVSVLPDGTPASPASTQETSGTGTGFGAVGGNCTMNQQIVRNAISADGSIAFWSFGGEYENGKGEVMKKPLFARIGGTETIQLDAKPAAKAGKGPFGEGRFRAATADGSRAFFTAPGKLTAGATAGDLYRYDTIARSLTNLTPGEIAPEGIGMAGISEDGSYVYFTARGALTGEEEGPSGEKAVKGAPNLYLWREGEGLRFIARLSASLDNGAVAPNPEKLTSGVTPDGRHLAFLSVESKALSGYDNAIVEGGHCQPPPSAGETFEGDPRCLEAYLYDAEAGTLTCASCNPSGARPLGPIQLPGWTNPYEGPHTVSDDGSKLFFESRDTLSAADENGKRDVYEFEQKGAGSCTSESPGFNPASGGCLALISSGKSEDESYLVDASADGRDVFFSTRRSLVGWDTNENYDIYDAREGGGFPEPSEAAICEAEACKAPPAAPPLVSPSPGTASFQGPGNAVEKKKQKHRHKARKHKSKAQKHKRASNKRRAGR
jgi:DNA-binding beta-propeller fold protein YncE